MWRVKGTDPGPVLKQKTNKKNKYRILKTSARNDFQTHFFFSGEKTPKKIKEIRTGLFAKLIRLDKIGKGDSDKVFAPWKKVNPVHVLHQTEIVLQAWNRTSNLNSSNKCKNSNKLPTLNGGKISWRTLTKHVIIGSLTTRAPWTSILVVPGTLTKV